MEQEKKIPGGSNEEELAATTSADKSSLTENSSKISKSDEQPPFTLKFITWNIDGLASEKLKARTAAVCRIIEKEQADIVFLQEVIPVTADHIKQSLPSYHCYFSDEVEEDQENGKDAEDERHKEDEIEKEDGKHKGGEINKEEAKDNEDEESETDEEDEEDEGSGYFIGTLLKKSSVSVIHAEVVHFPLSLMGRNLLKVNAKYKDLPICLLNSHLESLKDFSDIRKLQLHAIFKNMLHAPEDETVIFGGDTNLRDKELVELGGLPSGIEDVWMTCGSQERCTYTFDLYRNDNLKVKWKAACRFDRVFVRRSSPSKLKPVSFELIGLERLSRYGCFPSDHWGILSHFEKDDFKFKLDKEFSKDNDDEQVLQPYWMKKTQMQKT